MTHSVTRSSPADGIVVNSQTGLISASFSNPLNSSIPAVATNISIGLQAQNGDVDDDPGQYSVSITAFDSEGQTVWSNNYQVQSAATAINVSIPFPTFAYGFYIAISSSIAGEPDGDDGITLTTISYQLPSCEFVNLESSLQILTVPSYADEGSSAISAGEPVDPSNGNEYTTEEDISAVALGNPPSFRRYYNSLDTTGSGDMGPGWRHSYSRKLVLPPTNIAYNSQPASPQSNLYPDVASACQQGWLDIRNNAPKAMWTVAATYDTSTGICNLSNGAILVVYSTDPPTPAPQYNFIHAIRDDGHVLDFTVNGSNFTAEAGVVERLSYSPYGGFMLVDGNDTTEYYDPSGKLVGIVDRAGNRLSIYLGLPEGITSGNGKIIDQFGRGVIVNYFNGKISSVGPTFSGITQEYGDAFYSYDANGRLSQVAHYPDTGIRQYKYTDSNWPNGLSNVIDENGDTYATWTYDTQGRVKFSQLAGGVQATTFTYNADGSTTTIDAFQAQRTFNYQQNGTHMLSSGISGAPCVPCGYSISVTYDSAGFVQSRTDYNDNVTLYTNDDTDDRWRGLETSRTEGYGTAQARTITTSYDTNFRLPHEIDEYAGSSASGTVLRNTVFTYDPTTGGLTQKTVTDPATQRQRTWKYQVNSYGQTTQIDGPRTDVADVTTISYWPIVSGDFNSGQIYQIIDALGHTTTYSYCDIYGRPTFIIDQNNLTTQFDYWSDRDGGTRITGIDAASSWQDTSYSYYPTGQLQSVWFPYNFYNSTPATLNYQYNAAHQLTDVYDQLNNRIHYIPDAMGNNVETDVYDSSGNQVRMHQKHYNTLNQQDQDVGYYPGEVAQYYYDNNNNLEQITDPLSHITKFGYDPLNRRYQITDPNTNNTTYALNTLDQLTSVTDPRALQTVYTVDALNNLSKTVSPDSGTTRQAQIDDAGNVTVRWDANGNRTTYQYDAINRIILLTRSDGSTVTYNYDQTNDNKHYYGIGRLTSYTESASATTVDLSYDRFGNIAERDVKVGSSPTLVTQWTYDPFGTEELQSIALPSGNIIGYNWNNALLSNIALTTKSGATATLVSISGYEPFGAPSSWTFANGESDTRFYDMDGRIASDPVESIGYDAASRVNGWTLSGFYGGNTTFGYQDPIDFVASQTDTTNNIALSYTYDANGNRSKQIAGGKQTIYTIDPSSNHIKKSRKGVASPITYAPDADGSITGYGGAALTYDASERLIGYAGTTSYTYDGFGTRVAKTVGSAASTLFNYDDQKHLLGEYTAGTTNKLVEETVYMGDIPVAVIKPGGIYYVHADYRNAPRQIDDKNKVAAWAWYPQPYGDNLPNSNPAGLGAFVYNLRYPGQYYDSESGFFYNGARYYDPATGRYLQSDPLGVRAGINTYSYVLNRPLDRIDPLGLCSNNSNPTMEPGLTDPLDAILPFLIPELRAAEEGIAITGEGLDALIGHLSEMDSYAPNEAMIGRLQAALENGESLTGADANFYQHELAEAEKMANGMDYGAAHAAALDQYGVTASDLYHPDVIQALPEWFNNADRAYYGLPLR